MFLKIKKYYFNIFSNKKIFKKSTTETLTNTQFISLSKDSKPIIIIPIWAMHEMSNNKYELYSFVSSLNVKI